jgi:hypothetical protein
LDSITAQRRLPDELVVCDDGSTDGTLQVLRDFAARTPFTVRLYESEVRLGPTKNFERAIGLCEGGLIALADQDDVWHPQKLARCAAAFARRPTVGAVFSDAELIDAQGRSRGGRLWRATGFARSEQRRLAHGDAIRVLLRHNVVTGATLVFRAQFRESIVPIPASWIHDGWIALLVAAQADLLLLPLPLVQYRQHGQQHVGTGPAGWQAQLACARRAEAAAYLALADQYRCAYQRLAAMPSVRRRRAVLAAVRAKVEHVQARARIRQAPWRGGPLLARELVGGHYHRYSRGWRSAARDLLL